jgi:hypothetical protein
MRASTKREKALQPLVSAGKALIRGADLVAANCRSGLAYGD